MFSEPNRHMKTLEIEMRAQQAWEKIPVTNRGESPDSPRVLSSFYREKKEGHVGSKRSKPPPPRGKVQVRATTYGGGGLRIDLFRFHAIHVSYSAMIVDSPLIGDWGRNGEHKREEPTYPVSEISWHEKTSWWGAKKSGSQKKQCEYNEKGLPPWGFWGKKIGEQNPGGGQLFLTTAGIKSENKIWWIRLLE